ncbi:hypothetical protein ACHAW6_001894 [Cyclotella cf. meneghiniana]
MCSPSPIQPCRQSHLRSPFRQYSECRVTNAVQSFSLHRAALHKFFYSPLHFPKFLAIAMICSGVVGYKSMEWYWTGKLEERASIYVMAYHGGNTGIESNTEARKLSTTALARKMTFRTNDVEYNVNSGTLTKRRTESVLVPGMHRRITQFW